MNLVNLFTLSGEIGTTKTEASTDTGVLDDIITAIDNIQTIITSGLTPMYQSGLWVGGGKRGTMYDPTFAITSAELLPFAQTV